MSRRQSKDGMGSVTPREEQEEEGPLMRATREEIIRRLMAERRRRMKGKLQTDALVEDEEPRRREPSSFASFPPPQPTRQTAQREAGSVPQPSECYEEVGGVTGESQNWKGLSEKTRILREETDRALVSSGREARRTSSEQGKSAGVDSAGRLDHDQPLRERFDLDGAPFGSFGALPNGGGRGPARDIDGPMAEAADPRPVSRPVPASSSQEVLVGNVDGNVGGRYAAPTVEEAEGGREGRGERNPNGDLLRVPRSQQRKQDKRAEASSAPSGGGAVSTRKEGQREKGGRQESPPSQLKTEKLGLKASNAPFTSLSVSGPLGASFGGGKAGVESKQRDRISQMMERHRQKVEALQKARQEKEAKEMESCPFRPQINLRSAIVAQRQRQCQQSRNLSLPDRLHLEYYQREWVRTQAREIRDEEERQLAPFKPTLIPRQSQGSSPPKKQKSEVTGGDSRDTEERERPKEKPMHERLDTVIEERRARRQELQLKSEKEEREKRSFQPRISTQSERMVMRRREKDPSEWLPVEERLKARAERSRQRKHKEAVEESEKERQARLAGGGGGGRAGREGKKGSQQQIETGLLAIGNGEQEGAFQSFLERQTLYEQVREHRRAIQAQKAAQELTFKPKVNPQSAALAAAHPSRLLRHSLTLTDKGREHHHPADFLSPCHPASTVFTLGAAASGQEKEREIAAAGATTLLSTVALQQREAEEVLERMQTSTTFGQERGVAAGGEGDSALIAQTATQSPSRRDGQRDHAALFPSSSQKPVGVAPADHQVIHLYAGGPRPTTTDLLPHAAIYPGPGRRDDKSKEKTAEWERECTFRPAISDHSRALAVGRNFSTMLSEQERKKKEREEKQAQKDQEDNNASSQRAGGKNKRGVSPRVSGASRKASQDIDENGEQGGGGSQREKEKEKEDGRDPRFAHIHSIFSCPENLMTKIKEEKEQKDFILAQKKLERETEQLSACTFKPQIGGGSRLATATGGAENGAHGQVRAVAGLGRYLELQDLARRRREESEQRAIKAFGFGAKWEERAPGVPTKSAPFNLATASRAAAAGHGRRCVASELSGAEREMTFQPLTNARRIRAQVREYFDDLEGPADAQLGRGGSRYGFPEDSLNGYEEGEAGVGESDEGFRWDNPSSSSFHSPTGAGLRRVSFSQDGAGKGTIIKGCPPPVPVLPRQGSLGDYVDEGEADRRLRESLPSHLRDLVFPSEDRLASSPPFSSSLAVRGDGRERTDHNGRDVSHEALRGFQIGSGNEHEEEDDFQFTFQGSVPPLTNNPLSSSAASTAVRGARSGDGAAVVGPSQQRVHGLNGTADRHFSSAVHPSVEGRGKARRGTGDVTLDEDLQFLLGDCRAVSPPTLQ
uniref:Uncharacterized protein n=1 Tax=Chromera velia CCMP2878 TaxID=1169474 RepID=A0A0G4H8R7_9ALVE|eukprot:Cvel_25259.t1-p1 / transcript=Cvel_25259.t1 / gene=Cvel_25259 / organism=Chromera_velia_CCMP2878 / gene_product=hypothetical protein / transcript_product=hypothetical protein / location=Cvel_scaffold2835:4599-15013(+) / protein_length=1363 / sequence_SO=supercontig / SO=protein_coding / is_pseudo=false